MLNLKIPQLLEKPEYKKFESKQEHSLVRKWRDLNKELKNFYTLATEDNLIERVNQAREKTQKALNILLHFYSKKEGVAIAKPLSLQEKHFIAKTFGLANGFLAEQGTLATHGLDLQEIVSYLINDGCGTLTRSELESYISLAARNGRLSATEAIELKKIRRKFNAREESLEALSSDYLDKFPSDYQSFDPSLELKKIHTTNKDSSQEELEEYKQQFLEQQRNIAKLQKEIIRFARSREILDQNSMWGIVEGSAKRYRLSPKQLLAFYNSIETLFERHASVKKYRAMFPNNSELYAACFSKTPKGAIDVIVGPITLYFRCANLDDFETILYFPEKSHESSGETTMKNDNMPFFIDYFTCVANDDFKTATLRKPLKNTTNNRRQTDHNNNPANRIQGVFIPQCAIPALNGCVIAEKAVGKNGEPTPINQNIYDHEEQHAINSLWSQPMERMSIFESVSEDSFLASQHIKELLVQIREEFEAGAKDEIIAYFKTGASLEDLETTLTQKEGVYDYYTAWMLGEDGFEWSKILLKTVFEALETHDKKTQETNFPPEFNSREEYNKNRAYRFLASLYEKVFVQEYNQIVANGINAIKVAVNYPNDTERDRENIVGFLINHTLISWPKAILRASEYKSEFKE